MKKTIRILSILLLLSICFTLLASCWNDNYNNNEKDSTIHTTEKHSTHIDSNNDNKCDVCGDTVKAPECTEHIDEDENYICDECGAKIPLPECTEHVDEDKNYYCDLCEKKLFNPENPDDIAGITSDTIWVGNTAGTTGALAVIGVPFNLGIQAAFNVYNQAGGFNGKSIMLKNYSDRGEASNALSCLQRLIYEDEVFAIVGHFGNYAVDATLETLINEKVPMIYAASNSDNLLNENADTLGERGIFPVQPIYVTEGGMLILRAFSPKEQGGLDGHKIGVIYDSSETSQFLYNGILKELDNLPEQYKNNVVAQQAYSNDYTGAIYSLMSQNCDLVILAVVGEAFTDALVTMANCGYRGNVLTSYNNSDTNVFNDYDGKLQNKYQAVFSNMTIYVQSWMNINSTDYIYKNPSSPLYQEYKKHNLVYQKYENGNDIEIGVIGFTEEYFQVAENIYNYVYTVDSNKAFAMSYNVYAIVGYIAGDLFCQAMEELEKSGKPLTRENLVEILESKEYKIAMADVISFAGGKRTGVQSFGLDCVHDAYSTANYHTAVISMVYGLTSMEYYREILK